MSVAGERASADGASRPRAPRRGPARRRAVAALCVAALLLGACAASRDASDDGRGARAELPPVDFAESAVTWLLGDVPPDFADLAPPRLGILRVGVVVRDGAPVAGARVWLDRSSGDCDDSTCSYTDARGRFVLARADWDAGSIRDQGPSPHGGPAPTEELVSVLAPDGGFAKVHVPREPGAVSFTQIELGTRALELHLRDDLGRPVPDRAVTVRHVESGEWLPDLPRSDVDGRVRLGSLPPGCYELSVVAWPGRVATQVEFPRDDRGPRRAELRLGSGELRLSLRHADGRPAGGAQALLEPLDVPGLDAPVRAGEIAGYRLLAADGTRSFARLHAGRYRVQIVRDRNCLGEDALHVMSTDVTLARGASRELTLVLPECADASTPPVASAR